MGSVLSKESKKSLSKHIYTVCVFIGVCGRDRMSVHVAGAYVLHMCCMHIEAVCVYEWSVYSGCWECVCVHVLGGAWSMQVLLGATLGIWIRECVCICVQSPRNNNCFSAYLKGA